MVDIHEKSAAQQRAILPGRLERGAAAIGKLWRAGERCAHGWSRYCDCAAPAKFCLAKRLWIQLLLELGPPILLEMTGDELFFVILLMSPRDLAASGLRVIVQIDGREPLAFGPGAVKWESWPVVGADPAAWAKAVKVVSAMRA